MERIAIMLGVMGLLVCHWTPGISLASSEQLSARGAATPGGTLPNHLTCRSSGYAGAFAACNLQGGCTSQGSPCGYCDTPVESEYRACLNLSYETNCKYPGPADLDCGDAFEGYCDESGNCDGSYTGSCGTFHNGC